MKRVSKQFLSYLLIMMIVLISVPMSVGAAVTVNTLTINKVEGYQYISQNAGGDFEGLPLTEGFDEEYYTITETDSTLTITFSQAPKTFKFSVENEDGEALQKADYTATGTNVTAAINSTTGVCTLALSAAKAENVSVDIAIKTKNYNVTLPYGTGYSVTSLSGSSQVESGKPFDFRVNLDAGYTISNVSVSSGTLTETDSQTHTYKIDAVTADTTISVTVRAPLVVTLPTVEGYSISVLDGADSAAVPYGSDFRFQVTSQDGYGVPAVTVNNSPLSGTTEGNVSTYTISNVTSNRTIAITGSKQKLAVTVSQSGDGYITDATASAQVEYGGSYSFNILTQDGYNTPAVTYTTTSQSSPVTVIPNGNSYTVRDITENTQISIVGGAQYTNTVYFNTGEGYTITDTTGEAIEEQQVPYDGTVEFQVRVSEGYTNSIPTVAANSRTLRPVSSENSVYTYQVANIKEAQTISVSGLTKNTYSVSLTTGDGYALTSSQDANQVSYNSVFYFNLNVSTGYNGTNAKVYSQKTGGEEKTLLNPNADGSYSVTVTDNMTITVEGVAPQTYTATLTEGTGYTITSLTGNENNIAYNGSIGFSVSPKPGYRISAVLRNTSYTLEPVTDTTNYYINNITENQTITVVATPVTYTVHYVDAKGSGTQTVVYGPNNQTYDTETGAITLTNPSASASYIFKGWFNESGSKVDGLPLANENKEITLTANWEIDWENLFTVQIGLDENGWNNVNGKYSIRLVIPWAADDIEELADAKIVRSGVFYSNQQIASSHDNDALKGYIDQYTVEGAGHKSVQIGSNPLFLYYTQYTTPFTDLNGQFTQSFTGIKPGQARYATAWVEVEINGVRYTYFSGQWDGTAPTA